jgi:hypothetical protein
MDNYICLGCLFFVSREVDGWVEEQGVVTPEERLETEKGR